MLRSTAGPTVSSSTVGESSTGSCGKGTLSIQIRDRFVKHVGSRPARVSAGPGGRLAPRRRGDAAHGDAPARPAATRAVGESRAADVPLLRTVSRNLIKGVVLPWSE
jgi:hypothetical protein